jgi:hypothetical protein
VTTRDPFELVRFLCDQDVYAVTAQFLRDLSHNVVTASELGLSRATIQAGSQRDEQFCRRRTLRGR